MTIPNPRTALVLIALAAALGLGLALGSERWGGLVPCALCLVERWPYHVAIDLGILSLLLPRRWARWIAVLMLLDLLAAAGAGFVHVGVEQGYWPSPLPQCAAPDFGGGSIADRLARMPVKPSKPCDEPTYLIPVLPLSMAAMNTLYALALAGGLATSLWHSRRSSP